MSFEYVIFILVSNQNFEHLVVLQEVKPLELYSFFLQKIAQILQDRIKMFDMIKKQILGRFIKVLCRFG